MNRSVNERLMTVEEAMRVSELHAGPRAKFERPSIWAWQTVARAMAQPAQPVSKHRPLRSRRNFGA